MRVQGPESRVQGRLATFSRQPAPIALRRPTGRIVAARRVSPSSCRRVAFTLTELLVTMTILLILTAITVSAFNFSFTSERSRSAARQIQSYLEGARDRAIYAKEARGVRFLVDQNNPRAVSSMIFIGESEPWTEGHIRLERADFLNNSTGASGADGIADDAQVRIVRGLGDTGWYNLLVRGRLGVFEDFNLDGNLDPGEDLNGNGVLDRDAPRIKIPGDQNGSWYTVFTHRLTPGNDVLQLIVPYRDPGTTEVQNVLAFESGVSWTYRLELPPVVLPNEEPVLLPSGIVIDLDGSHVPAAWRPPPGSGVAMPYSGRMDVMFSPRGTVTGSAAARGLIHFYLAELEDVLRFTARNAFPVNVGGNPSIPGEPIAGSGFTTDEPVGDRLIATVFTHTGKVSTHPVNPTDVWDRAANAAGADGYADDPFLFAETGEVAGQ